MGLFWLLLSRAFICSCTGILVLACSCLTLSSDGHMCSRFACEIVMTLKCRYVTASRTAHLEKIVYHVSTERRRDRRAVFKAWTGIDFDEPSLQALINHKVVPKQLMGAPALL